MPLTTVMYHYVRDLPNTKYPAIKGLLLDEFDLTEIQSSGELDEVAEGDLEDEVVVITGVAI